MSMSKTQFDCPWRKRRSKPAPQALPAQEAHEAQTFKLLDSVNISRWQLVLMTVVTLALLAIKSAQAEEIAAVPGAAAHTGPFTFIGQCDGDVAVFRVQNAADGWVGRGLVRVVDGITGEVLRERSLALGKNQAASFRLPTDQMTAHIHRLMVVVPGRGMTYVKTFTGNCIPEHRLRTARR